MNSYIVLPIFIDSQLHPLHKDNHLSLLYVKELNQEPQILTFDHLDSLSTDNFNFLEDNIILTPNKKHLLSIHSFKNVYDINLLNYYLFNKPLNFEDIRINAIDTFNSRYYNINNLNAIIPIYKHLEYCNEVANRVLEVWNKKDEIDWDSYEQYNNEAILAFYSIEKEGVTVSNDVIDIFDKRTEKHLSDNKLFTDYFLYTSAGRPSNSYGSINFAALDENKRKAIIPNNDMLFEFDYDAYHVRLIAELVKYQFPEGSIHKHLAKFYGSDSYQDSKAKTFKYLYGGVPQDVAQLNPFFSKVRDLSDKLWNQFKRQNYVETPIYKRKLLSSNLEDMNRNKLLNYIIQATETEHNIKTIIEIQRYLYTRKTRLILYNYDSFLFDYCKEDGLELLKEIMKILEKNNFLTKIKMGLNFGQMSKLEREKLL